MLSKILLVGLGGSLGSISRYLIGYYLYKSPIFHFPWPTFIANIAGCLLIGVLIGLSGRLSKEQLLFFTTGFCGGVTTFSTFSMENILLIERGDIKTAILYTTISLISGVLLGALGYFSVKQLV